MVLHAAVPSVFSFGIEMAVMFGAVALMMLVVQAQRVERWRVALVLAVVLAVVVVASVSADFPVYSPCYDLTIWDWEYWFYGCLGMPGR